MRTCGRILRRFEPNEHRRGFKKGDCTGASIGKKMGVMVEQVEAGGWHAWILRTPGASVAQPAPLMVHGSANYATPSSAAIEIELRYCGLCCPARIREVGARNLP